MTTKAYLVTFTDQTTVVIQAEQRLADRFKALGHKVEPLAAVGTLTPEQRATVEEAIAYLQGQRGPGVYHGIMAGLQGMLRS